MPGTLPILFTAFEPSGDNLAARLITTLRADFPDQPIIAMGGPKMADAGAELLEQTTGDAAMLLVGAAKVREHSARIKRFRAWLGANDIKAHVPVDSPAANWHYCKTVRKLSSQSKIVHLAAPQLWAWAPWRIGKLRRNTDMVLCILPFEPAWFAQRGVEARFVGHPLFDPPPDLALNPANAPDAPAFKGLPPGGAVKLALLPGSRKKEVVMNWPTMIAAVSAIKQKHPSMSAVIAASDEANAALVRELTPAGCDWIDMKIGRVTDILHWADTALVVSGTATLQTLAHRVPLVTLFNVKRWQWLIAKQFIRTKTFTLPNLIGEAEGLGRIVTELVPHFGEVEPVRETLAALIEDSATRAAQLKAFDHVRALYERTPFHEVAARALMETINRE